MPRKFLTCLTLATGLMTSALAFADENHALRGVVELFTAQGCASCPPADAAFEKLVAKGDVVALAYHVDYWNYLGWSDTLSTKENTARQYAYAKSLGRSSVYTPQAVINGREHMNGADLGAINGRIDSLNGGGQGLTIPVSATRRNGELDIDIGGGKGRAEVIIAYFHREQTVHVLKGENSGRQAVYWNSVYDLQTVGMWEGLPMRLTLPASVLKATEKDGFAVLVQTATGNGSPSAIVGATIVTP